MEYEKMADAVGSGVGELALYCFARDLFTADDQDRSNKSSSRKQPTRLSKLNDLGLRQTS